MSWKDTLQDASFRGVIFEVQGTSDNVERAFATYGYPYVEGEDIEDLGRKARKRQLTALIWGDDYEDRLAELTAALDEPGPGELVHPVFGSIPDCLVVNFEVKHDTETPDFCIVDITFIETTPGTPFFNLYGAEQLADQISGLSGLIDDNMIESVTGWVDDILDTVNGVTGKINGIIDDVSGIFSPLTRISGIRDVFSGTINRIKRITGDASITVIDIINTPRDAISGISRQFETLSNRYTFSDASFKSDWSSLSSSLNRTVTIPSQVAAGIDSGTTDAAGNISLDSQRPVNNALPQDVAVIETVIETLVATELAANAGAILADEAREPTLPPSEIEHITNDTREAIQNAVDSWRERFPVEIARPVTEPLKNLALQVQETAKVVIEQSPPLIQRQVESATNMHLLAHLWYGNYSRAGELLRLNPLLRNPNDLKAGDILNAYAK